ncbi:hypothetical protein H2202_007295 [Exophiala xenobiotica]|nr:hypothetical protein H2202_007295 [Exophiala xenobiotica]
MAESDHWKGLPSLAQGISSDSNGQYSVSCSKESDLEAKDAEYQYSTWFQTPPLDPPTIERLHGLQLIAESHDQGFSDVPSAGNWTWFELALMENERSDSPRVKDDVKLTWYSHVNRFCTEDYGWDGNVIAVRLCARFAGWHIWAKRGYLVMDIGAPVKREPLSYGQIVYQTKAVQEAFLEVNNALQVEPTHVGIVHRELFSAQVLSTASNPPLRVLALDGGGVRGVAALMLLDAVMQKIAPAKKPCEVFDLIGGTSTGGFVSPQRFSWSDEISDPDLTSFIAIMLGRFKMTIAECLAKYKQFMSDVFPKKEGPNKIMPGGRYNATELEEIIKQLVKEKLGKDDMKLLDDSSQKDPCKVFVVATKETGGNNSAPVLFRSYKNPLEMSELPDIKIWQAARATSAAPTYFDHMKVGNITFMDGGLQANNPLGWLWNEVLSVFGPARLTNCFLSIGTGTPLSVTMNDTTFSAAYNMSDIATNSEMPNILFRSLINAFAPQGMVKKYWRLNVGDGMPDWVEEKGVYKWKLLGKREESDIGDLDDVSAIQKTETRANAYLQSAGAVQMVADAAAALSK